MDGGPMQREYVERLHRIAKYNAQQKNKEQRDVPIDEDTEEEVDGDHADGHHDDNGAGGKDDSGDGDDGIEEKSDQPTPQADSDPCEVLLEPGQDPTLTTEGIDQWHQFDAAIVNGSTSTVYDSHPDSASRDKNSLHRASRTPAAGCCTCLEMSCKICLRTLPSLLQFIDQSPFYGDDRAWLHVFVIKSELTRCSLLALAHYWSPNLFGIDIHDSPQVAPLEASSYYSMTLTMLQECIANVGSADLAVLPREPPEILIATINMIFFQVLEANGDHWQIHLRAGIDLLRLTMGNQLHTTVSLENAPSSLKTTVGRFVVDTFVWLETLSSTLFWDDKVPWDHAGLVAHFPASNTGGVALLGCSNWVIVALGRANHIRRWKDLMTSQGSLSNIMLVKQVSQLQDYIGSQLQTLHVSGLSDEMSIGTYLYAQATSVYVHVLASGAYPEIPEIRHTLEDCLPKIEKAAVLDTAPRFAWALCIIGCMIPKELQRSFRAAMEKLVRRRNSAYGYARALATIQECWLLRSSNPSRPVHWASAMGTLGNLFLVL